MSFDVECTFKDEYWHLDETTRYTCIVPYCDYIFTNELISAMKLIGEHQKHEKALFMIYYQSKTNNDVTGLSFEYCRTIGGIPNFFIESFHFTNLTALSMNDCDLYDVERKNFKSLAALEAIDLSDNYIRYLPSDLFMDLNNLKAVSFSSNELVVVGPEIFDHLTQLTHADFSHNPNYNVVFVRFPAAYRCYVEMCNIENVKVELNNLFFTNFNKVEQLTNQLEDLKAQNLHLSEAFIESMKNDYLGRFEFYKVLSNCNLAVINQIFGKLNQDFFKVIQASNLGPNFISKFNLIPILNKNVNLSKAETSREGEINNQPLIKKKKKRSKKGKVAPKGLSKKELCEEIATKINNDEINPILCQKLIENPSFYNELNKILDVKDFKDFTVTIGEQTFKVHKLVLAARSPVLADMIRDNPQAEELNLVDIPVNIFQIVLSFMYGDKIEIEDENSREIFMAAGRLKIVELQNMTAENLIKQIKPETAVELLSLSNKYNHNQLRQKCFVEVQKLFPEIKNDLIKNPEKLQKLIDAKIKLDEMTKKFQEEFC